jgi:hypothetical protein
MSSESMVLEMRMVVVVLEEKKGLAEDVLCCSETELLRPTSLCSDRRGEPPELGW